MWGKKKPSYHDYLTEYSKFGTQNKTKKNGNDRSANFNLQ